MRLFCLLLLTTLTLSCGKPVVAPESFTYDDGKGSSVQLKGKSVKVTSSHFDAIDYQLASDNMFLKLTEFNATIDSKGTPTGTPPTLGNGVKVVAAGSLPDAQVLIAQLVPTKDGVGPDSAWVGGRLDHSELEGGFWTVAAMGNTFVIKGNPPNGFEKGQTVVVIGNVNTDEMNAAQSGPQYTATAWRLWKD